MKNNAKNSLNSLYVDYLLKKTVSNTQLIEWRELFDCSVVGFLSCTSE